MSFFTDRKVNVILILSLVANIATAIATTLVKFQ